MGTIQDFYKTNKNNVHTKTEEEKNQLDGFNDETNKNKKNTEIGRSILKLEREIRHEYEFARSFGAGSPLENNLFINNVADKISRLDALSTMCNDEKQLKEFYRIAKEFDFKTVYNTLLKNEHLPENIRQELMNEPISYNRKNVYTYKNQINDELNRFSKEIEKYQNMSEEEKILYNIKEDIRMEKEFAFDTFMEGSPLANDLISKKVMSYANALEDIARNTDNEKLLEDIYNISKAYSLSSVKDALFENPYVPEEIKDDILFNDLDESYKGTLMEDDNRFSDKDDMDEPEL